MSSLFLVAWLAAVTAPTGPFAGDAYIVVLSDSVPTADVEAVATALVRQHGGAVEHVYREGFKGFAARLPALSASGMRRDARVAGVEIVVESRGPAPVAAPARTTVEAPRPAPSVENREPLPYAPGWLPRFRRVQTPTPDRYRVVLAAGIDAPAAAVADELMRAYAGDRGPVENGAFEAAMSEAAAQRLSRDARVDHVEEQSAVLDPSVRQAAVRNASARGIRRAAQPMRDRYVFVLRADVPAEHVEDTVAELLRAYEGRPAGASRDPRVISVEMSEPAARALSEDFRVESVEEQSQPSRADTGRPSP
jgi:hypothetical protein